MQPVDPRLKNVIIARINDAVITEFDVSCGLELAFEPHRDTKGKVRLMQNEQYELRQAVIDRLITRELLYQEGVRRGTDVSPEEFENALRVSMQEFQSEEHFAAVLALQGQTLEDYKEQLKRDLITNKVAAAVVEGRRREVTDADARAYYDTNRSRMQGPEMRHILLVELALARYAEPADVKAAQTKLEPCTRGPEAFMEVFESKKPKGNMTCRDLGLITRGQYHPLLDSVAFRMKSGQVSRIVRTEENLNVLYIKTVLAEGHIWPFEDVVENLRKSIYEMQSVEMINEFVKQLRQSSSVAVYDTATQQRLDMEK